MKTFQVLRVFHVSSHQAEQMEAILQARAKPARLPGNIHLFVDFEFEESLPFDLGTFEEYCRQNNLKFRKLSHRSYSKADIGAAEFFKLSAETVDWDTETTRYTRKNTCPNCGVGLSQMGPLIIKRERSVKKKVFCVDLEQSREWIVNSEVSELLRGFLGFHFGPVCTSKSPEQPLPNLKQIIIEHYLPRMATITAFSEYRPPLENRCSCNRAGWNLKGEKIYARSALKDAEDFNLTIERWYGGGIAGLNWPIVSQRVRRVMLDNKLLRPGCFEPVRIIDQDPGTKYPFELPLDAPLRSRA